MLHRVNVAKIVIRLFVFWFLPVLGVQQAAAQGVSFVVTDLGVASGVASAARSVNNAGQVTGFFTTAAGQRRAFLWSKEEGMRDLGVTSGYNESIGLEVTEKSEVLGLLFGESGKSGAYWKKDGRIDNTVGHPMLDSAIHSYAINSSGTVVTNSSEYGAGSTPVIWTTNDGERFLNGLIDSNSGWQLTEVADVNDQGQIVGMGIINGQTHAFLLTPAVDLATGFSVGCDGDFSGPFYTEVGETLTTELEVSNGSFLTAYSVVWTATVPASDASNISATFGDCDSENYAPREACSVNGNTVTCNIGELGPQRQVKVEVNLSPLRVGNLALTSRVTSSVIDPNPSNNSYVGNYNIRPQVKVASLTVPNTSVLGGQAVSTTVTLDHPFNNPEREAVALSSSNTSVATVPASVTIPSGTSRTFNVMTKPVTASTAVNISASFRGVTKTVTLTVLPSGLSSLTLTPALVFGGCQTSTGKVTLSSPAPAGGATVALSVNNSAASVPASVVVPSGSTSKTFTISTQSVSAKASSVITASFGGSSKAQTLTVEPNGVVSLTLTPNPVVGPASVTGTVKLGCPAGTGGVVVELSSSATAVARPNVASITIPAGATSGTFAITTADVSTTNSAYIYAKTKESTRRVQLQVNP